MKDYMLLLVALIGVFATCGIVYSLFAGIWGYNPTPIEWFNAKLLGTCLLIIFLVYGILSEKWKI